MRRSSSRGIGQLPKGLKPVLQQQILLHTPQASRCLSLFPVFPGRHSHELTEGPVKLLRLVKPHCSAISVMLQLSRFSISPQAALTRTEFRYRVRLTPICS